MHATGNTEGPACRSGRELSRLMLDVVQENRLIGYTARLTSGVTPKAGMVEAGAGG